jgi:hypothetical protein
MLALTLSLVAMPASAQAPGNAYLGGDRCVTDARGQPICGHRSYDRSPSHAYERWDNGGPAFSGSSNGGFPLSFRGYGTAHDFGR